VWVKGVVVVCGGENVVWMGGPVKIGGLCQIRDCARVKLGISPFGERVRELNEDWEV
jgi:hypothetical protein